MSLIPVTSTENRKETILFLKQKIKQNLLD